mmetsp:Transcript_24763/g.88456  ORF Transcript_24763/g.88456 Transcript_24763/m.88456 type:complete len:340 (-) Transcript_24763:1577-2596(-)
MGRGTDRVSCRRMQSRLSLRRQDRGPARAVQRRRRRTRGAKSRQPRFSKAGRFHGAGDGGRATRAVAASPVCDVPAPEIRGRGVVYSERRGAPRPVVSGAQGVAHDVRRRVYRLHVAGQVRQRGRQVRALTVFFFAMAFSGGRGSGVGERCLRSDCDCDGPAFGQSPQREEVSRLCMPQHARRHLRLGHLAGVGSFKFRLFDGQGTGHFLWKAALPSTRPFIHGTAARPHLQKSADGRDADAGVVPDGQGRRSICLRGLRRGLLQPILSDRDHRRGLTRRFKAFDVPTRARAEAKDVQPSHLRLGRISQHGAVRRFRRPGHAAALPGDSPARAVDQVSR